MRKEDFKSLDEKYIEVCQEIIFFNGQCVGIQCHECVYDDKNYSGTMCIHLSEKELLERTKQVLKYIRGEE